MSTTAQAIDAKPRAAGLPVLTPRNLGRLFGVWLAVFPAVDFILRPPFDHSATNFDQVRNSSPQLALGLVSAALLGMMVSALGAGVFGVDFRRAKYLALACLPLCLAVPLSFVTASDFKDIYYVLLVYGQLLCAVLAVSSNVDRAVVVRHMLATLAILHTVMLTVVLIDHDFIWGRLYGRNSSNYWGMVAQTTLIASLAMRGWIVRAAVIVMSLMILYFTQSRGSMVAVAAGLSVAFLIYSIKSRLRIWLWLSVALGLLIVGVLAADFVADDLLLLSDPGRGFGSGVSGRTNAWRESWDLFANHPWLGVGFRQHEQYLLTEASAHNAYLAMLADMGVVGLLAYGLFVFGGLWRAITGALRAATATNLAIAAFLSAYVVNGLVERTALDSGTAYCQLMVVLAAWAWRFETDRAAPRPAWN